MTKSKAILEFKASIEFDIDNSKIERKRYTKKYITDNIIRTFEIFGLKRALGYMNYALSQGNVNAVNFVKSQVKFKRPYSKIKVSNVKYIPSSFNYRFERINKPKTTQTESNNP